MVSLGSVKSGDVICHWAHAVLEVHQVEKEVGESGQLGVELALRNEKVTITVDAFEGVVAEALHEADLVTVRQVFQVLEEALLFRRIFIVVTVLLDSLLSHVLSPDQSLLGSSFSMISLVDH